MAKTVGYVRPRQEVRGEPGVFIVCDRYNPTGNRISAAHWFNTGWTVWGIGQVTLELRPGFPSPTLLGLE